MLCRNSKPPTDDAYPVLAGITALAFVAGAQGIRFFRWNLEDALIIFRIVRNLIGGQGWAFNPGEQFNPSTSALNTVILALASPHPDAISAVGHVLGSLYLWGSGAAVFLIFRRLGGDLFGLLWALLCQLLLSEQHPWGFGLETYLFIFLLSLYLLGELQGKTSWVLLGLLTLARPDGAALAALRAGGESLRRRRVPLAGIIRYLLVLLPWVAFSLWKFGQIFPQTLSNKMWQGSSGFWGRGWIYVSALSDHIQGAGALMGSLYAVAVGVLLLWRRIPAAFWYVFVFAALQQAVYALLNVPGYLWYFTVFDFCVLLAAGIAVSCLADFVPGIPAKLNRGVLLVIVAVSGGWFCRASHYQVKTSGNEHYSRAISILESAELPAGALAAAEVGTLGFGTQRPIVDLLGLTSKNSEYITGRHLEEFFARPPALLVVHSPPWDMEQALADDPRIALYYEEARELPGPGIALQYYALRSDISALRGRRGDQLIRHYFAGLHRSEAASPSMGLISCHAEMLNGRPAPTGRVRIRAPLLKMRILFDTMEDGLEVLAVLRSKKAVLTAKEEGLTRQGTSLGLLLHLLDVPAGRYHLELQAISTKGTAKCILPMELEIPQWFVGVS